MPDGVVGMLGELLDLCQSCMSGNGKAYSMSENDMKKMMDSMQAMHQALTGKKRPMKEAESALLRKRGVVYIGEAK